MGNGKICEHECSSTEQKVRHRRIPAGAIVPRIVSMDGKLDGLTMAAKEEDE